MKARKAFTRPLRRFGCHRAYESKPPLQAALPAQQQVSNGILCIACHEKVRFCVSVVIDEAKRTAWRGHVRAVVLVTKNLSANVPCLIP